MKHLHALSLTVALTVVTTTAAATTPVTRQQLIRDSQGEVAVTSHLATGKIRVAHFKGRAPLLNGTDAQSRSVDFLGRYGAAFGIDVSELGAASESQDALGKTHLSFGQHHNGVPVFGAMLRLHFSADGELEAVNGSALPKDSELVTEPSLTQGAALGIARSLIRGLYDVDLESIDSQDKGLWIYNRGLVRGRKAVNRLVWRFELTDHAWHRDLVLVDAHSGLVVEQVNLQHHINRTIYFENLDNPIWNEGDPQPFDGMGVRADDEINTLISISGEVFNLFSNISGGSFLSWDGEDGIMHNIYDSDEVQCPNATSNNGVTRYCPGTAVDDIIAHEWTHSYTDGTSDLIYLWQSGALNESYSDMFGEAVDLLNDSGNDEPDIVRTVGGCSAFAQSSGPLFVIDSPAEIMRTVLSGDANFNPPSPWTVEGTFELVDDGVGNPHDGCEELVGFTPGNIALVEFATCLFQTPARNAEAAGAVAMAMGSTSNEVLFQMFGDGTQLEMPSVFIGNSDRQAILDHLDEEVHATISSAIDEESWRWLIGEDTTVFGRIIRDMWNPGCMGHPGRVSDSAYWCSEQDAGGVHSNSGVPNHAFSLLVDGGEFNDQTITAIGMTKAAHIHWRALSVYQTLTTNFAEHADILELSCTDLVGQPLTDLTTGDTSSEIISQNDCSQVTAALAAVEMRLEPTQCSFQPLLNPNAPPVADDLVVFSETFDEDPGDTWTMSNDGITGEWTGRDWRWTTELPEGGEGGALLGAFERGVDPCSGAIMHLDSPLITLSEGTRPMLTFDHWVGTVPHLEGGNLKISVNGSPFVTVERSDFVFNRYNASLPNELEDNPLAGQAVFSGFDEGELSGSWGQSQVDLNRFADVGDTIQIRFDTANVFACNSAFGWYIDNVEVLMASRVRSGGDRVAP